MINKINKLINNKFSRLFKFIFFIRYLLAIFFVAIILILFIPQFFDYNKRLEIIKINLLQQYGLKINRIGDIKFSSFPLANLEIKDLSASYYQKDNGLEIQKLIIYPKLLGLYDFKNFHIKKLKLEDSKLKTKLKNLNLLSKKISNLNKKIYLKDLNIEVIDNDKNVIVLKRINFYNYGYKKNILDGEVFDKKFKMSLKKNSQDINFILYKTGISGNLRILDNFERSPLKGVLKGKVLKSNFKLDFIYDGKSIKLNNFLFRDKELSFNAKGYYEIKPFSKITSTSEIKNINTDILKKINVREIFKFRELIKRINGKNNINFISQRFNRNLIDSLNLKTNIAYGQLNIDKKIKIANSILLCNSNVNLLDEFPILYFDCSINSPDKKDLLKKIKVKYKKKKEIMNLNVSGYLNILSNKINFDYIELNDSYVATEADKQYLKNTFEEIMFDKNFIDIFNLSKIKNFIEEII